MAKAGKDVSRGDDTGGSELEREKRAALRKEAPNPVWFKPLMFGFMLLGLIWIVLYYVTSANLQLPIPALEQANIFVGFGLVLVGFMMTPWWK